MPLLIKNQGLALEKMGIPVTRSLLVQRLTLLTNIDLKKKTYGIAFVLKLHTLIFVFLFIFFFYFYDAITEPYTGGVDLILHKFNSYGNILNHMTILPEPLLSSHLS